MSVRHSGASPAITFTEREREIGTHALRFGGPPPWASDEEIDEYVRKLNLHAAQLRSSDD